jgi:hypothetical protein
MGEPDPVRLGDEPEQGAVTVEGPGALGGGYFDRGLFVPVDQTTAGEAATVLVEYLDGSIAIPLDADDLDESVR